MKHDHTMGDRFRALIAYDPLAGLHHKKHRREGGRVNSVADAESKTDRNPTPAQKIAGNYSKGKCKIHGLTISIENPRGSIRTGKNNEWKVRMPCAYGYILGTVGADTDHVDAFVGPHLKSPHVFVIDQHDLGSRKYDEHKVMLGFGSKPQAKEYYHRAFSDGRGKDRIGHIEAMTVDGFKDWLKNSDTTEPVKHRADGGRIHMADGGAPNPFDALDASAPAPAAASDTATHDTNPFDALDSSAKPPSVDVPTLPPEAADHGLSERQKLSPLEKAISPITSYPDTYHRMMHESLDQAYKGVQQILHPESVWDEAKGLGNAAAGTAGYVASPISAAYRSVAGQPIEDVTGIPREYTEFAAQLATPGIGMTGGLPKNPVVTAAKDVPPPSTKELFKAAENNYKNMHGYGVEIHPHVVADVADGILDELHTQGYRDYLAPKTFRAVQELKNPVGANSTTQDIEGVRRALNKAGADPAERDAARRAIAAIDGSMSNMAPSDVAVNPHFADRVAKEAADARGNYAAAKRSELLDEAAKKADRQANSAGSGTNIDNATRQQIKAVLNNPKKLRGFSAEEKDQMEKIIRGTAVGNTARLLGKFSPSGVVSGGVSLGAGALAGEPVLGAALPIAGYAAKKIGDASTARQAAKLSRLVRSRSPLSRNAAPMPTVAPSAMPPLLSPPAGLAAANLNGPYRGFNLGPVQGPVPSYADDKQP